MRKETPNYSEPIQHDEAKHTRHRTSSRPDQSLQATGLGLTDAEPTISPDQRLPDQTQPSSPNQPSLTEPTLPSNQGYSTFPRTKCNQCRTNHLPTNAEPTIPSLIPVQTTLPSTTGPECYRTSSVRPDRISLGPPAAIYIQDPYPQPHSINRGARVQQ